MTWLLILLGMAGPALLGEYDTDDACYQAAEQYLQLLQSEHQSDDKWHPPAVGCVGVPDEPPGPADGKRI